MINYIVSLERPADRTNSEFSFSSFKHKISEGWAKRETKINKIADNSSYSVDTVRKISSLLTDSGILSSEYGQASTHISLRNREIMGGVYIGISKIQNTIASSLFEDDRIIKVFLDSHSIKDNYIIITDQEYSMFSLDLADKYWELFDRFEENYPNYSFEFEHFIKDEIPTQTLLMKEMFPRSY